MELKNELPKDLHLDEELDNDDGAFVYHTESGVDQDSNTDSEVGEDNNMEPAFGEAPNFGSDSNTDYNSSSDSEQEMQLLLHPRRKRKRGMTRLPKLCTEYSRYGWKKHVKFDALGRLCGRNRALFVSYLGDLVRQKVGIRVYSWKAVNPDVRDKLWEEITHFFDVEETRRKFVMNRMGMLLRNFRRKVYAKYIKPNLGNPTKLARIPKRYHAWDNFVTHTQLENFNSSDGKRGIYHSNREAGKLYRLYFFTKVANDVIARGEMPARSLLWRKGREDKNVTFRMITLRSWRIN
ncbi:hypothetical protein LXL04_023505 [Taraxacum kok-saghyz]